MEVSDQLHTPAALPSEYPLGRRLGGLQIQFGYSEKEKNFLHCPFQELNLGHPACSQVIILTELPQLYH
jgi:hypothetical protein